MYHPKTNGPAKRINRALLAALRHSVAEHLRTWDEFSDALTYVYNTQPHSSTHFALFELVLTRSQPTLALETRLAIIRYHFPRQWYLK